MLKIYVLLPDFTMLKMPMVCVLIVQLPIHVMNTAPEQTIHRKSEGDNKSERKRWRSVAVIMSMSGVSMEEINPLARWYKAAVIRVQETCFSA